MIAHPFAIKPVEIAFLKKDVSIWNINSFAEFYMQIAEKYKKDYAKALVKFRAERERYLAELSTIDGIRVIPTQANYVMVELLNGKTAKEITKKLVLEHNILIKDLRSKMGGKQFVRLAIRNEKDNDALISALKKVLK